jgi:transcriptional regulator with XRE-family HTH domain
MDLDDLQAVSGAARAEARIRAEIGARVRTARRARGLTGRALAERTGVTSAFISQIERGQATPSLSTLLRLIYALGITIGDLFDVEQPAMGEVLRRGDWAVVQYDTSEDAVLHSDRQGRMHAVWSRFPGNSSTQALIGHAAEHCFAFVLSGKIELDLDGTRHALDEHASVPFDGRQTHTWINVTSEPAEVLVMITELD